MMLLNDILLFQKSYYSDTSILPYNNQESPAVDSENTKNAAIGVLVTLIPAACITLYFTMKNKDTHPIETYITEIKKLTEKNQKLTTELENNHKLSEQQAKELLLLKKNIEDLTKNKESLIQNLADLKKQLEEKDNIIETNQKVNKKNQITIEDLNKQLLSSNNNNTNISELQKTIKELENNIKDQTKTIDSLNNQLNQKSKEFIEIETEKNNNIKDLEEKNKQQEETIKKLIEEIKILNIKIEKLEEELKQEIFSKDTLTTNITKLQSEITKLTNQNKENTELISNLQAQLKNVTSEKSNIEELKKSLESTKLELQKDIESLNQKNKENDVKILEFTKTINQLNSTIAEKEKTINDINNTLKQKFLYIGFIKDLILVQKNEALEKYRNTTEKGSLESIFTLIKNICTSITWTNNEHIINSIYFVLNTILQNITFNTAKPPANELLDENGNTISNRIEQMKNYINNNNILKPKDKQPIKINIKQIDKQQQKEFAKQMQILKALNMLIDYFLIWYNKKINDNQTNLEQALSSLLNIFKDINYEYAKDSLERFLPFFLPNDQFTKENFEQQVNNLASQNEIKTDIDKNDLFKNLFLYNVTTKSNNYKTKDTITINELIYYMNGKTTN